MMELKKEFKEYLSKIGITSNVLLEQVRFMYELASNIFPEEIEQIFVEDTINNEGTRIYESLYFFSTKHIGEARNFVKDERNFCIFPIGFQLLSLDLKDYDFINATHASKLKVEMRIAVQDLMIIFVASKENCDVLRDIIMKYMKPKL